jgi:hypothetical protein
LEFEEEKFDPVVDTGQTLETQGLPMEVTTVTADQNDINKQTTTSQVDDSTKTLLLQESIVTTTTTYEEWKPATDIDILRQSSYQECYRTISDLSSEWIALLEETKATTESAMIQSTELPHDGLEAFLSSTV